MVYCSRHLSKGSFKLPWVELGTSFPRELTHRRYLCQRVVKPVLVGSFRHAVVACGLKHEVTTVRYVTIGCRIMSMLLKYELLVPGHWISGSFLLTFMAIS